MLGAQSLVWQGRSFYGVITVTESDEEPNGRHRLLRNGRITHGMQFLDESKRRLPTSYYGPESGVGQAITLYRSQGTMRIGVVGLGTGTIATYARPRDVVRFYEINDQVIDVARRFFSYLNDCRGTVEVAAGDARLSLEREADQEFDVLVLDAFSGDAIPTHLLTTEAFDVYDRQLNSQGSLCIHVSNRYLDLTGVVLRLAERHGYQVVHVDQEEVETQRDHFGVYGSDWFVLSKNEALLSAIDKHVVPPPPGERQAPLWTDAQTDLFTILK
jgi:hypothetical protein